MPGGPEIETGETVTRRARRRRLRDTYQEAITSGEDTSSVYVMKVMSSLNEMGILIDACISWLEKEVRNISKLGFDTSSLESDLKRLEQEFDQNNHLNAIGISEHMSETIKKDHLEYFQNGSSMILSSIKRRIMEYEGIGINIAPVRSLLQEAIEDMRKNSWEGAWEKTRRINLVFAYIEKSVEEGTEDGLDLKTVLESIGEMTWEIDVHLERIQELMKDIPIDDTDKTLAVLANIKKRIIDAKSGGRDVALAIEKFKMSEPEIRENDNLRALVWAKLANDELLMLDEER
jgi:hypothetical protein